MCFTEKCLICVPLGLGSLFIGILSFISSFIVTVLSIIILVMEENNPTEGFYYIHAIIHLDLTPASIKILVSIVAISELFMVGFSVLLIIGVKKNKPSLVLTYFLYGVFMTIMYSLSGLLLLITGHWLMAMIDYTAVIIFIHFLIVVHTTYDYMIRGKLQDFETDQEFLIETSY